MVLVQAAALILAFHSAGPDSVALARRIAASAQLAAQEYRIGVVDGKVVMSAEVDEARLFLGEARRTAVLLPQNVMAPVLADLDLALSLVARIGSADSIDAAVRRLGDVLVRGLGITLVDVPARAPSLARGAELYRRECASCHGIAGRGDGPGGLGLNPAPANLTNHLLLADVTPLAFYQRITIGVAGTAMPAYETRLPPEDRWALALYATTLRQERAAGEVPVALRPFSATAELNDQQILLALGVGATRGQLAAVRGYQAADSPDAAITATFDAVRGKVAEAERLAQAGDHDAAVTAAFDAYLLFEQVERTVRAKKPGLATTLEASFATLRTRVAGGATAAELAAVDAELLAGLEQAQRVVGDQVSSANLFGQSLVILLREGLEAILIIGALMAFLVRVGAGHRRRDIHIGVGAAVALSLLTALMLETVFHLSPANQEVLEGITMVTAVLVLFYVSYWLLSKLEVQKWTAFVRGRVQEAVTGGSAFALASAAFLAVYREGFETVLFYKALFVSGGSTAATAAPVIGGMMVGGALLALVYIAINRYGVRLPLKPFFAVTSAFLYYTAFVFAGKAVAELQAGGVISTTVLPGWPRLPAVGIYPTLESILAQVLLVVLALAALGWVFLVQRPREALAYAAATAAQDVMIPVVTSNIEAGPGMEKAILRSLEQMEADLAAIKAEVERLRATVIGGVATPEA